MIIKQLRISRLLSQEQLAQMSGLNVRTIQRIESGHVASPESLKCIAAALDTDVATLGRDTYTADRQGRLWNQQPLLVKCWFLLNYFSLRPSRMATMRVVTTAHASGFLFCLLGLINEAALVGGLLMLATAYFFQFLAWQGDRYGVWYELDQTAGPAVST